MMQSKAKWPQNLLDHLVLSNTESYHSSYNIVTNLKLGNWEMKCLRGDIITDLHQKFQDYKISALTPKQRNYF